MLVISLSVKLCLENGGGFNGKGCVSHAFSPIKSDFLTFLSFIGNNGSPVSLLSKNT